MYSHLEKVRTWLKENVKVFDTPEELKISAVKFDWKRLSGTFVVSLDGKPIWDRFSVHIDITGKPTFTPPMFHSPLGAPASYAAVELDPQSEAAIFQALEQIFPKVRPFGWNKDIDLIIDAFTPFEERIYDQAEFDRISKAIDNGNVSASVRVATG